MSNQYANSVAKQQIHEMIEKQRDLLAFLEAINSNLEEEGLCGRVGECAGWAQQPTRQDVFEAAGLAEEKEEEEEVRQFTTEDLEDEEIRRDVAMMERLQEQRRAYFEEGIISEDSLGRAYVFDYYGASTSADLSETEGELSCEEESRGRKRKDVEDDDDEDDEDEE